MCEDFISFIFNIPHNNIITFLFGYVNFFIFYSDLNATTGSFLDASLAGTSPEIDVNKMLINTIMIATDIGSLAIV